MGSTEIEELVSMLPEARAFLLERYPRELPADWPAKASIFPVTPPPTPYLWFSLSGIGGLYDYDELERSTAENAAAVERAATRAIELFEAAFPAGDHGWLIARIPRATFRQRYLPPRHIPRRVWLVPLSRSRVRRLRALFPADATVHVDEVINPMSVVDGPTPDGGVHEVDTVELTVAAELRRIEYRRLLWAVARHRLFGDEDECESHFVSSRTGIHFHLWDDRGCTVTAPEREAIRPLYDRYRTWLDEEGRDEIDALFADAAS